MSIENRQLYNFIDGFDNGTSVYDIWKQAGHEGGPVEFLEFMQKGNVPTKTSELTNDSGYVVIDDNDTNKEKTWSSSKIKNEVDAVEEKLGGTVEITSDNPSKANTVMTIDPSAEEVNVYSVEEVDAITDELSDKADDMQRQINVERARINTFTALGEGSTTGDAELEDARVDYVGNTHDNVGEHIRTVTNELNEKIVEETGKIKETIFSFSEVNGTVFDGYISVSGEHGGAIVAEDGYFTTEIDIEIGKTYVVRRNTSGVIGVGFNNSGFVDGYYIDSYGRYDGLEYEFVAGGSYKKALIYTGHDSDVSILIKEDIIEQLKNAIFEETIIEGEVFSGYISKSTDSEGGSIVAEDGYFTTEIDIEIGKTYVVRRNTSGVIGVGFNNSGFVDGYAIPIYDRHDCVEYSFVADSVYKKALIYTGKDTDFSISVKQNFVKKVNDYTDKELLIVDIEENGISFESGSLSSGTEIDNVQRARSIYIPVTKGSIVCATNKYRFFVTRYDVDKTYIDNTHALYGEFSNRYVSDFDGYIRLVVCHWDYVTEVTDFEDISDNIEFDLGYSRSIKNMMVASANDGWAQLDKLLTEKAKKYITKTGTSDGIEVVKSMLLNHDNYIGRGKLIKSGRYLQDADGNHVIMRGVGLHQLNDYFEVRTEKAYETLKYYGVNCIRISVYLTDLQCPDSRVPLNGYINHSNEVKAYINEVIPMLTRLGFYIVLDWHSYHAIDGGDVTKYTSEQEQFFWYFSNKYKDYDNIMYELHNEPYINTAEELLPSIVSCCANIRNNKSDAIIIVGRSGSGAEYDNSLWNTTNNLNVFVSEHYYLASNENNLSDLINNNIPLFVSEWGNSSATGADNPDFDKARDFMDELEELEVSHLAWKLTFQNMDTAIFKVNPTLIRYKYANGGMVDGDLSPNGKLYFEKFTEYGIDKLVN